MTDPVSTCRALGDPTRWRIARLVMDEALCVCELADILGMPQSSVSSHVQVIRRAGLLESERCEKWTYFRLTAEALKLLKTLVKFFPAEGDPILALDAEEAARRLERRKESCCPGPEKLTSRTRTRIRTTTIR